MVVIAIAETVQLYLLFKTADVPHGLAHELRSIGGLLVIIFVVTKNSAALLLVSSKHLQTLYKGFLSLRLIKALSRLWDDRCHSIETRGEVVSELLGSTWLEALGLEQTLLGSLSELLGMALRQHLHHIQSLHVSECRVVQLFNLLSQKLFQYDLFVI